MALSLIPIQLNNYFKEINLEQKIENKISLKNNEKNLINEYKNTKNDWKINYDKDYLIKLEQLKNELINRGHNKEDIKILFRNVSIDEDVTRFFRRNLLKSSDTGEITFEEFSERIGLHLFVDNAQDFAEKYKDLLIKTEKKDGVDLRYIVGIFGIETRFGNVEITGNHNLVNSLVTQYITTSRQRFALRELNYVLELSKKFNEDLSQINCSYAGAIGVGQWIPSSIYYYSNIKSIDDLFSVEGMVPSVSNYLKLHNWDKNGNGKSLLENRNNWNAVRAYNHSDTYVRVVNEIAKGVDLD